MVLNARWKGGRGRWPHESAVRNAINLVNTTTLQNRSDPGDDGPLIAVTAATNRRPFTKIWGEGHDPHPVSTLVDFSHVTAAFLNPHLGISGWQVLCSRRHAGGARRHSWV